MYDNRDRNKASSLKNARSPVTTPRVKIDICGPHQDVRRHIACEKGKTSVLQTKAQQVIMKLVHILHDVMGLGSHKLVDKFRCAHICPMIPMTKLGFGKVLFIEFAETLQRRVLIDVPEHKFASSVSADTGDVKFYFAHVVAQFRVLSKPMAQLNQHSTSTLRAVWRPA
jgi:hypothetical protein